MRTLPFLSAFLCLLMGLGATAVASDETPQSAATKIAGKAGLQEWDKVESIAFTFNVEREGKVTSRAWKWNPQTREVTSEGKTYSQGAIPENAKGTDAKFINDQYWLLFPFQLVWSTDAELTLAPENVAAPISGTPMRKLTIQYPAEGGYTPGDAYDVYYGDDYVIREWAFRKGGKGKGSPATWEGYQEFGGLKIATEHKFPNGGRLFFTDISVERSK